MANIQTDPAIIAAMQASLAQYRAGKSGATGAAPAPVAPVAAPAAPAAPVADPTNAAMTASLADYRAKKASGASIPATPKDPGALADFAKGIFGAPATLLARPVQAVAELAGATADQVDAATSKIPLVGGLIAPVDRNAGDVLKDVGRGAQTVALGVADAPIAAGALFGAGTSVEAGNPILSAQTAIDTALGAGGGKVLDWIGKPLLNAAGKVVGTITLQVVKDVAAGGADAIKKFASEHDLPLGISKVAAPVSKAIQDTASAIDTGINKGTSAVGNAVKETAASQYPGLNPTEHYKAINEHDIVQPTTVNEPRFATATRIYNNAKGKGIDLETQATKLGIQHDQLAEGNRYNTLDTVDNIRQGNFQASRDIIRPAIEQVQHGIPRVSVTDVKNSILNKIDSMPSADLDAEDKAYMKAQIEKRYKAGSANEAAHPEGYNLEDLHDSRISSQAKGKFKKDGSALENRPARLSRIEGETFADIFDRKAPPELQAVRGELEKNFKLANYLEALHGKSVPQGITQKAVRLFGRAIGGIVGSKVGGFPGFLFGSRGGDMLFNSFETLPNPIKKAVLTAAFANKAEPEVFQTLQKYLGTQETERLLRLALPAGGESSAPGPVSPTLFSTPGGQAAPDLQNAVDMSASEISKKPGTNRRLASYLNKVTSAQENQGPYVPPGQLPAIQTGSVPRSKTPLKTIKF